MSQIVERLVQQLGPIGCLTDPGLVEPYLSDWRDLLKGKAICVTRPATVEELSSTVRICGEEGVSVVPQGGNTNLTGAATPDQSGRQVIISTVRLNKIRSLDLVDMTTIAEAGVTVAGLQRPAADVGALFPLSFASEGTATLGGALATNAGGISAVRYGSARDLLLGLEVVLPDGRIWNALRTLRKDNAGYALRQLFAGSEGTLGIITAAAMKLKPLPAAREVTFCSAASEDDVLELWRRLYAAAEGSVRAVEYISGAGLEMVGRELGLRTPVEKANYYVLVELDSPRSDGKLKEDLEAILAVCLTDGVLLNAAIAQSAQQQSQFWRLREDQTEAQKRAGFDLKHDVAVPVSAVPELLRRSVSEINKAFPDVVVVPFGHLGDGNIHLNVVQPRSVGRKRVSEREDAISGICLRHRRLTRWFVLGRAWDRPAQGRSSLGHEATN